MVGLFTEKVGTMKIAVGGALIAALMCACSSKTADQTGAVASTKAGTIAANESAAIGALRSVSNAEMTFQLNRALDTDGDGIGEYGSLSDLASISPPMIDAALASGEKNGYLLVLTPAADPEAGYSVTADPKTPGVTGNRHFFVDESGVITFNARTTASANDEPV
jgi:hypothetical protein